MEKEMYTFTIYIDESPRGAGESDVDYPVSEREFALIEKAQDEGEEFSECEKLKGLYKRVMKAAGEKLLEDLSETGEDEGVEVDDLVYSVDF